MADGPDPAPQTPRDRFRQLCAQETSIPIFCRDWWLDAVAPGQWDVALVETGGRVVAAMPYALRRRWGLRVIAQPPLTQFAGPWVAPSEGREQRRLEMEKDLYSALIDQLPRFDRFSQNWHHGTTNWLPFHWRGFRQTTRYTYRLADLGDLDAVWAGFSSNIRSDVRKAQGRFGVRLRAEARLEDFLDLNDKTFARQSLAVPYGRDLVRRIDAACAGQGRRAILIAEDAEGRAHAGCYLVWDEAAAYYLMGGGDPALRSSGATSLVLWEAIRLAAGVTRSFDFEGSMLEPVERFFRAFGARQTAYFSVSKDASRLAAAATALRTVLRAGRR